MKKRNKKRKKKTKIQPRDLRLHRPISRDRRRAPEKTCRPSFGSPSASVARFLSQEEEEEEWEKGRRRRGRRR